jgi:hypothetical protein
MGKILLTFDARADAAEKKIEQLQKQMEKLSKEPAKQKAGMEGFGKSVSSVAGKLGIALSAATAVSKVTAQLADHLERGKNAARQLGASLQSAMAGAGIGAHTQQVREFVRGRQQAGGFTLTDEDVARTVTAFTSTRPSAQVHEVLAMLDRASDVKRARVGDMRAVDAWTSTVGELTELGGTPSQAHDLAWAFTTGLSDQQRSAAMTRFRQQASSQGFEAALRDAPVTTAVARGGASTRAIEQLEQMYQQTGGEQVHGSFQSFIGSVDPRMIQTAQARRALLTIRNRAEEERAMIGSREGAIDRAASEAMADQVAAPLVRAEIAKSRRSGQYDPTLGAERIERSESWGTEHGVFGTAAAATVDMTSEFNRRFAMQFLSLALTGSRYPGMALQGLFSSAPVQTESVQPMRTVTTPQGDQP